MRCFRCLAGDAVYEQIRLTLDSAWGHPNLETGTVTCIDPAGVAPKDNEGRIMLATKEEFCGYSVANEMLPALLSDGVIEEITLQEYLASLVPPPS